MSGHASRAHLVSSLSNWPEHAIFIDENNGAWRPEATPTRTSFSMSAMIRDVFGACGFLVRVSRSEGLQVAREAASNGPVNSRRVVLFSRTRLMILSSTSVDVHDVLDGVAGEFERAADEVRKAKVPPVADVAKS